MTDALLPVYRRSEIVISRGEGCYLYSPEGNRYLDFATGIAVNALGHGHPKLVEALKSQAEVLWYCSNIYRQPQQERLAERYVGLSFANKVFFCSSGTEAVECGLKMVRKHFHAAGNGRYRIITFDGGFHGRTLACISAGGNSVAREGFEPLLEGFDQVAFGNLAAVEAAVGPQTAGILVEPVQGEGGVRVADKAFLHGLRALADKHELLLMFDEVQCGMGRTGALFTHTQYEVKPDIMTLAKGIGGGFPLAACLATDFAAQGMLPGTHGSTYGANPLAMAVGNAVLDVMLEEGFFAHVERMGALLKSRLKAFQERFPELIEEVRGMGLMLGLKMRGDHRAFAEKLRHAGLLTAPSTDNVIRVFPPLIVEEAQVEEAFSILEKVCGDA